MWHETASRRAQPLPHAAGDLIDRLINGGIHVLAFGVRLNVDVVGTVQDDLSDKSVFLNVENGFGFDDARVVQMESFDLFGDMIAQGIGHLLVTHRNGDRQIDVGSLHGSWCCFTGEWMTVLSA